MDKDIPVDAVAIIGAGCRVPGATTLEQFWSVIAGGQVTIERFTADAARREGVPEAVLSQPGFIGAGGTIENIDMFDAALFGIAPSQAAFMDPQQRVFLECVHDALEHAGHGAARGPRIGIWAGSASLDYLTDHVLGQLDRSAPNRYLQQWVGVDKDYLAAQVAYRMDFGGPAITVQTACSTSLVAVVLAVQGLLSYQCDIAVAGGASIGLPQRQGYVHEDGSILAADGACRPFTTQSSGTVFGNGAGAVILRRLEDALDDGDSILAVIRGAAINNDGAAKVGFTAPGGRGQGDVIRTALALGEVDGASIEYVETHGTGTAIGDAVELSALTSALGDRQLGGPRCAIGSVKANVGHMNAAAGVCGLIKVALAVQHAQIPPTVGAAHAIDELRGGSPYYLPTDLTPWSTPGRRAGVSSFGIGGTNAHVILEASPRRLAQVRSTVPLLLVSAREDALRELCANYAAFLEADPDLSIEDVCFTAAIGRLTRERRVAFRSEQRGQLISSLKAFADGKQDENAFFNEEQERRPEVTFAFGDTDNLGAVIDGVLVWQTRGVVPSIVCGTGAGLFAAAFAAGALSADDARNCNAQNVVAPSLLWISAFSGMAIDSVEAVHKELAQLAHSRGDGASAVAAAGATLVLEFGDNALGADVAGVASFAQESLNAIAGLWTGGIDLDLTKIYSGANRVSLPTYPFQRKRFWIDPAPRYADSGTSTFLGRRTEAPMLRSSFFDAQWSVATLPFLCDHMIYGKVIVSGAALAVMIAEGVREVSKAHEFALHDLRFPAALVIPQGMGRRVQLQLVRDDDGFDATVLTQEPFEIHATARVETTTTVSVVPSQTVQGEETPTVLLDSWLRDHSVVMGPSFSRLSDIVIGHNDAVCSMRTDAGDDGWLLHPGILDSALQLLAVAARPEGNKAFVPTRIARLTIRAHTASQLRCYAAADRGLATLFDDHGVLAEMVGLESREVSRNELLRIEPLRDGYSIEWRSQSLDRPFELPQTVVVLRDAGRVAEELADILLAEGKRPLVADSPSDISFETTDFIIDCRGADARATGPDLSLYEGALDLLGTVARNDRPCCVAIVLPVNVPSGAPLQALARVAAMETPYLRTLAVRANDARTIRRGLDFFDRETEVMVDGEGVSAPRFHRFDLPRRTEASFSGDETWLITGGLGELGLRVASWLSALGVRSLVLTGRHPPDADAQETLAAFEHEGIDVQVIQADLANDADIEALLHKIDTTMPALRGICHLAGVVEDRLMGDVTPASLKATFAGKAQGAWLLHERTLRYPLKHFILFSSAAAAFGAPGQATYAMANAYLDELAVYRRSQGMPALSIAWGPWQDIGMAARTAVTAKRRLSQLGIGQIEEECGRATFENILFADLPAHAVLLAVDWQRLVGQWPPQVPFSRFDDIVSDIPGSARTSSVNELLPLSADERRHRLFQLIAEDVSAVTGTDLATLDPERSLFEYDLDSLLITDLRLKLERRFGRPVAATVIFSNPTVAALADHMAQTVFGEAAIDALRSAADQAHLPVSASALPETSIPEHLSQEDVVEMLSAKLEELRGGSM